MKVKVLIIGTGPCGLGAAYRLKDLGDEDFLLLEKQGWVGGLSASFEDDHGFTWDIGGHVQFSHYEYFDQAMDQALGAEGWLHHERESWVWIKDRFVPYPFQNNIRYLPPEVLWRCLKGIVEVSRSEDRELPRDFREWILRSFGEGIAAEFLLPYNYKVWAYPPEDLAYHWIGERVAVVNLERILENIVLEKDDVSWGPNNTFQFPKRGGTGAIWRSMAEIIGSERIWLNAEVQKIDPRAKQVTLTDGRIIHYQHLLSTIPLDACVQLVQEFPEALTERAQQLKYSSSNIFGFGIKGSPRAQLKTKCWMYFPEDDNPFYRVTLFSNYSPNNVPDSSKYFSLMTEVAESPEKQVDQDRLVEENIEGMLNTKLIQSADDIVDVWSFRAQYGYPTPSLERDKILGDIIPVLDKLGVYSRGRFGGWKYEVGNQDHTFMQGVEWIDFILSGQAERTFTVTTAKN